MCCQVLASVELVAAAADTRYIIASTFLSQSTKITARLSFLMATDANKQTPRQDSVVGSINSPEEAAEVVRGFNTALKALNTGPGFKNLVELVDQIPRLESEIREKEKTLKSANEAIKREKVAQDSALKKNLQHYSEEVAQVQKQKSSLEQQASTLKISLSQKDDAIAKFEGTQASLKEAGRKIESTCKALKNELKTKDGEIAQLQQQSQDNNVKIASLAADLKKAHADVSNSKASLRDAKERGGMLEDALKAVQLQQQEVAGYAVRLEPLDQDDL